jgi:hypothetical protein
MDFKKWLTPKRLIGLLVVIVIMVFLIKPFLPLAPVPQVSPDNTVTPPILTPQGVSVRPPIKNVIVQKVGAKTTELGTANEDDVDIQEQLDRDRQQQKLTKDLKNKLEQTNLELEQEKALSEITKLKKENMDGFNEPSGDGQSSLPEIKIEYIGGGSATKEAILSIGTTIYQVKEKSSLTDNIQVVSISDSSVTVHFSAPQDLTKTIEFKPE